MATMVRTEKSTANQKEISMPTTANEDKRLSRICISKSSMDNPISLHNDVRFLARIIAKIVCHIKREQDYQRDQNERNNP